ncbi:MAG: DUF1501 domain-containing protein [Saprospiraceae bacterium]
MQRRNFLRNAGAIASFPFFLKGMSISALAESSLFDAVNNDSDRVLILVQLNGGNDGLNMLIPMDQYSKLFNARSEIIIPESKILSVAGSSLGFHPKMDGMRDLFQDGKLGIVQSVGYPNHNRSHFRSTEIWTTGSPSEEFWNTGWAGRYLDDSYPGFPQSYPNQDHPDPFAISMGYLVSDTCQGQAANFSLALTDPFGLRPLSESDSTAMDNSLYGMELDFLQSTISQTNSYGIRITDAAESGNNMVTYPDTDLAKQLKNVALLISGGMKTRIYTVNLGGFDTHAMQVDNGDKTEGRHADLLETLSGAIHAFQEDLRLLGIEDRVMGMTFSEFGRQIRSNGSSGSDHGTAAPLLLFGSCVNSQIMGDNPEIPANVEVQEGVPMQYDFRDVYGSILVDWFGMDMGQVGKMLHEDFQYLPLVSCSISAANDLTSAPPIEMDNYPNPFENWTTIRFKTASEWAKLSIFDAMGNELRVLTNQKLMEGEHEIRFDAGDLPAGNYYYRLLLKDRQRTKPMVKVR